MRGILIFAGLIIAGYITRILIEVLLKSVEVYKALVKFFVNFVYYVLIPLAFIAMFLSRGLNIFDLYTTSYFISFMLIVFISIKNALKIDNYWPVLLVSTFPNSVFLGLPVCQTLLGQINITPVFGVLTITLNILTPDVVLARRNPLKTLLTSTAFLGFFIGVIGYYMLGDIAKYIYSVISWSPTLLSYTATYTMGLRMPTKLYTLSISKSIIVVTGVYRFVIAPLLALLISSITGMTSIDRIELAIVSMMPPAVMNALIAEKYKWDTELVTLTITLLTVLFLVAVFPVLYFVAQLLLYQDL